MKINISPLAMDDLSNAETYIKHNLSNPDAAARFIKKVRETFVIISAQPEFGAPVHDLWEIGLKYRFCICDNYIIFYMTENNDVIIFRVLYKRRNYLNELIVG